jgi:putative copper resistance protein D
VTISSWDIALVAAKWLMLLATAGAVGGAFTLALARKLRFADQRVLYAYLQHCGLAGLLATLLWFLLQVGAVNRSGLGGMLDMTMGAILLQSGLGDVLQLRLLGFTCLTLFTLRPLTANLPAWQESTIYAGIAVVLIASFGDTGHVSALPGLAHKALALHVLAVFLWIGALRPLLHLSRTPDLPKVQELMRIFGVQALGIVAVLLVSGLYLATQLLQTPAELLTTPYGRVLLLKLLGVYTVLMLAAMNKLLLVPRLLSAGSATGLQKSIRMEWIVALLVLAVTSWLTTITGPAGM